MPATAGVEMEEKGFSLTSPGWPLGMVVVEPAGRGTELVVPGDWAVEEMQGVMLPVWDRMGRLTPVGVAEATDMPARLQARADRVL